MPYSNIPSHLTGKMDSCVEQVMSQGHDKQSAIAICYRTVVEAQESQDAQPTPSAPADSARMTENLSASIRPHTTEADAAAFTGKRWDITIIGPEKGSDLVIENGREYVRSKNGRFYAVDALQQSASLWSGAKVYDNHLTDAEFQERAGMRSVKDELVGIIRETRWDPERRAICGDLHIVDMPLASKLREAWAAGVLHEIGLSIDADTRQKELVIDGRRMPVVEEFGKIFSVDLVAEPAAGGRFNRITASAATAQTYREVETMELTEERVKQMIDEAIAARPSQEQVEPEEAAQVVADAAQEVADAAPAEADPAAVAQAAADAAQAAADEVAAEEEAPPADAMEAVRKLECRLALRDAMDAAKLDAPHRRIVEAALGGRIFSQGDLKTMIDRAKEAQVAGDKSGQVTGAGATRSQVTVGMSPRDKAEIEFLRLVAGSSAFRALEGHDNADVRSRLTESHKTWINSGRPNYGTRRISEWAYNLLGGDPFSERAAEAATTSGMSSIVKNTVNILLAANYAKKHEWWGPIVREEEVDTIDDATLVRVFGLSTLSAVGEGQAYTELTWDDEEETASFVKKGNYVGVTMETILRDKLNVIRSIPDRLATSWYNTLSSLVSSVFTTNTATGAVLADTGALFNSTAVTTAGGHANLLTTALGYSAYSAARIAMLKQTDQPLGVGQRLLVEPRYLLVPVDLETAALQIRNSEMIPGSANNDVNPFYQQFDVVKVPDWTDANDWALVADPNEFPAIWLIFLSGRKVPELYAADAENAGAMFTNDVLRYKVRMLTFQYSSTYTCAPVSDFRPLHKSNVT